MNSEWAEAPKEQARSLSTPGAQLAAQREAMGWSVEQIADQLKLAPRQVVALEAGDYAALPNLAVVRGFVRAYAKVVKLDATPLVAMIEVKTSGSVDTPPPVRREISATFSESRFPSLTERSSNSAGWLVGAVVAVAIAAAAAYAWQSGLISPAMFSRGDGGAASAPAAEAAKPAEAIAPLETALIKPGQETAPLQSPSVPLISVPPPAGSTETPAPGAVATTPAAAAPAAAPAVAAPAPVAAAPAPAPAPASNQLVLKVNQDSWIEIRRPGKTAQFARLVKAGNTETFEIEDAATLTVGKPTAVEATLGGVPLALPPMPGSTISRVSIK
ncbi:helix-turn-helix domain-containing protein [Oxalobacteraceae bacterium]|nr:helix-turn-helix domain-containing protein [Oxalobacteraceae bacterium]